LEEFEEWPATTANGRWGRWEDGKITLSVGAWASLLDISFPLFKPFESVH